MKTQLNLYSALGKPLLQIGIVVATSLAVVSISAAFADETPQSADDTQASDDKQSKAAIETPYQPKSKSELKRSLSRIQYYVTQDEGTEKAFRNPYWNNKKDGSYQCVVCGQPLFKSDTKFKSGTGWPSFFDPIKPDAVGFRKDWKLFYSRTEVHCKRCKSHLGHVFDDGPKPTGKRYCMNSASLKFVEKDNDAVKKQSAKKDD